MNPENTIINMTNIETIEDSDDVKINIMQRKSECFKIEAEKIEEDPDVCCICLDNMYGDTYVYNACNHKIHEECYKAFVMSNNSSICPLCRTKDPKQNIPLIENINENNHRIINIINLNISSVHPEGIHTSYNIFHCNKYATAIVIIWALVLLMVSIFTLPTIFK